MEEEVKIEDESTETVSSDPASEVVEESVAETEVAPESAEVVPEEVVADDSEKTAVDETVG